jgi:nucleoside phosphorylase
MKRTIRCWFLLLLICPVVASAIVPVSYRSMSGETWAQIAATHGVTPEALRAANPAIAELKDAWIRLPEKVSPPRRPVVALLSSGYKEVQYVVENANIHGAYRIVGREIFVGSWNGVPIVAGAAGGNMGNAAIGTTVALQHFDIRVMGFVGIAGGSGSTRVGDVLVASGAVQHDQGNWFDFQMPGDGGVFAGLTWNSRGPPIMTDRERYARQVLTPPAQLLARIRGSVEGFELAPIGADVAAFHGVERYRPRVLFDGWSASGSQFITSHHARATIERRLALAADNAGLPRPRHFIVDQEDFGAIQAAVEHEVPWFVVRIVVDLAAQKSADVGLPLSLYDTPEKIPAWLEERGQRSHDRDFDYSYFYRELARVLEPIVRVLGPETK